MKRIIVLLTTFISFYTATFAQKTAQDFLTGDDMVWYGLDFTKAKFVGSFDQMNGAGAASGTDIVTKYIPAWNMIVLNEQSKYDLRKAFRKANVFYNLDPVEKNNANIDVDAIMSYNSYKFDDPDKTINEIIANYSDGEKKEGVGVVFIVEYFDKMKQQASYYVTVFDIKTKKVLIKQHIYAKPGGFGLRNYWARTIYNALKSIDSSYYKKWKKEYLK